MVKGEPPPRPSLRAVIEPPRAFARCADRAAMGFDDALADGEAKPGASDFAVLGSDPVEFLEDARQLFALYSASLVTDREHDLFSRTQAANGDRARRLGILVCVVE